MHARIEQLLSIRDAEPVEAGIVEHIGRCASCSARLRELAMLREQLRSMPHLQAPAGSWEQIQLRMAWPSPPRRPRFAGMAAAAAAIVTLSVIAIVVVREEGRSSQAPAQVRVAEPAGASQDPQDVAAVAELVVQSQQLEHLLRILPERPRVERVSTAATIDTIEQRIQWLDYQLSDAAGRGLNEAQARRLWRERVELMDSLVKVRYAEAGRASF